MLNASSLKSILIDATWEKDYEHYWPDLASAISDYITNNAEISAMYVGAIGVVPSALNGAIHKFKASLTISPNIIKSAAVAGVPGLNLAMSLELSKTTMSISYTGLFTVAAPAKFISIYPVVFTPSDDYQSVVAKMANGIINALTSSIPLPPVLASPGMVVASDGSTGVLTIVGIM